MAKFKNPRKQFNYQIEIVEAPIDPFLFQDVDWGDSDIEQDSHGDVNYDIKTPGRASFSNITLSKLLPAKESDTYFWDWHRSCQDTTIGGAALPSEVKRTIQISELAPNGVTVLNTWIAEGCWPAKINGQSWKRGESGNSIETIELSVDRHDKI